MTPDLTALHFLRPMWLWALLALPPLAAIWLVRRKRESVWRSAVDPHLLPHLLEGGVQVRRHAGLWLAALAYLVAVVALAGPSWRQVEQPLWQSRTPLVVVMDLSSAALAADLPPTRLAQAQAKITALLRERRDGQVGLVAYAGDAFTVAPLTDDAANVALFVPSLHPQVMPVDGQRADLAIAWAARLLRQAGFDRGQILLLTGQADAAARDAAAAAVAQGYSVSVLGVGGVAAAPYRRPDGSIATTRLDAASLRAVADSGGGNYATLTADSGDLRALAVLDPATVGSSDSQSGRGRTWQDQGYWLVLPLMLLALLAFRRRGGVLAVLLVFGCLPWQSAPAAEAAGWWQRFDQAMHERLEKGAEAYRQDEFARAAEHYRQVKSADGQYNLGNALARQGRYKPAIEAYDRALQLQPGMADALANKRAVQAAMQRKPPPGQKPQQSQNKNEEPGDDQSQDPGQEGQDAQGKPGEAPPGQQPGEPGKAPPADQSEPSSSRPEAGDPADQAEADAAQREQMQRALEQAQPSEQQGTADAQPARAETPAERERRLANEAWLRRVPDDPGGLLREKFRLEYERRQREGGWEQ